MTCVLALEIAKSIDDSVTLLVELFELPTFFLPPSPHWYLQKIVRYFGKLIADFEKMMQL